MFGDQYRVVGVWTVYGWSGLWQLAGCVAFIRDYGFQEAAAPVTGLSPCSLQEDLLLLDPLGTSSLLSPSAAHSPVTLS